MWPLCHLKIRGRLYHSHCFFFFLLGNRSDPRNKLVFDKGQSRASKRGKQSSHVYGTCIFPVLPLGQTGVHGDAATADQETVEDLVQGGRR